MYMYVSTYPVSIHMYIIEPLQVCELCVDRDTISILMFLGSEGDPLVGWNKPETWRADARYAAMVVKVCTVLHVYHLVYTAQKCMCIWDTHTLYHSHTIGDRSPSECAVPTVSKYEVSFYHPELCTMFAALKKWNIFGEL